MLRGASPHSPCKTPKAEDGKSASPNQARAAAARTKIRTTSNRGFGNLRKTCHATKLIAIPPRGNSANVPVCQRENRGIKSRDFGERRDFMSRSVARQVV